MPPFINDHTPNRNRNQNRGTRRRQRERQLREDRMQNAINIYNVWQALTLPAPELALRMATPGYQLHRSFFTGNRQHKRTVIKNIIDLFEKEDRVNLEASAGGVRKAPKRRFWIFFASILISIFYVVKIVLFFGYL